MKLFQGLFKKKKKKEQQAAEGQEFILKEGIYRTAEERNEFVQGCCDIINEAKRRGLEAKKEYEVVTAYLADIQRIDMLSPQAKHSVTESARKVVSLDAERQKMQKIPPKITIAQRNALEPYEETILDEIKRIEENELYLEAIQSDLRQLESEKASLDYEVDEILTKDESGQKLFKFAAAFIIVFLVFLFAIQEFAKKDIQVSFLLTVALGLVVVAYFYFSNRRNQYDLKVAELKLNKVILLINKVKIKYVNCINLLEYEYEKFHIASAKELHYHWQEYMRIKDEERRFKKVAEMIDLYTKEMVRTLKVNGVQDAAVWTYQPEALVDPKEMVEVRHRLNVRRQKLRQRIDYNNEQEDQARKSLRTFRERHKEFDSETRFLLARNDVDL